MPKNFRRSTSKAKPLSPKEQQNVWEQFRKAQQKIFKEHRKVLENIMAKVLQK